MVGLAELFGGGSLRATQSCMHSPLQLELKQVRILKMGLLNLHQFRTERSNSRRLRKSSILDLANLEALEDRVASQLASVEVAQKVELIYTLGALFPFETLSLLRTGSS